MAAALKADQTGALAARKGAGVFFRGRINSAAGPTASAYADALLHRWLEPAQLVLGFWDFCTGSSERAVGVSMVSAGWLRIAGAAFRRGLKSPATSDGNRLKPVNAQALF